jgi:hypothetical protein
VYIPSSPDPSTVASGPTGTGTWGWDGDGSYGDWYAGHELGHTFGRYHPGFCADNSHDDNSFPYPDGHIANNDNDYVGLDFGDTNLSLNSPRVALSGTVWTDIMTYCQRVWLSAYTYGAIYGRLLAEDRSASNSTTALRGMPISGAARSPMATSDDGPASSPAQLHNLQPDLSRKPIPKRGAPEQSSIVQGSAAPAGPTIGATYGAAVLHALADRPEAITESAAPIPDQEAARANLRAVILAEDKPPATALRQGDYVNIIARLNLSRDTGHIEFVNRVTKAMVRPQQSGEASLRFLDSGGRIIARIAVPIKRSTDIPPNEDQTALVDATVLAPSDVSRIELLHGEKVLDTLTVPSHAPQFHSLEVLRAPAAAASETAPLAWEATHQDGAPLTYSIQISSDDAKTWQTVAVGLRSPQHTLTLSETGGRKDVLVRIIANDGFNSTTSAPVRTALGANQ